MEIEMSVLGTSFYFFLDTVVILKRRTQYRLVVYHNRRLLVDQICDSLEEAKITFMKIYWYRINGTSVELFKAGRSYLRWTHFYEPVDGWLEKMKGLNLQEGWNR